MCGRYAIIDGRKVLDTFARLNVKDPTPLFADLPRYNASPMQRLPVFAVRDGTLTAGKMLWWLIPHWSKDGKPSATTFNAKSETVAQSRLFAPYFKSSRCLVPADAFYEWTKIVPDTDGPPRPKPREEKQPMCIRMRDGAPFMFAGLFSVWKNEKEEEFPSFTILTTTPNDLMAAIHQRMPVILPDKDHETWLDREFKDTEALRKLLVPYPAKSMIAYPVSRYVSNSRNEGKECMEELKEDPSSSKRMQR